MSFLWFGLRLEGQKTEDAEKQRMNNNSSYSETVGPNPLASDQHPSLGYSGKERKQITSTILFVI